MLAPSPDAFANSRRVKYVGGAWDSVLSTDGHEWRLTVTPDASHSVFHWSRRGDSSCPPRLEVDLLAVRLRCIELETMSH